MKKNAKSMLLKENALHLKLVIGYCIVIVSKTSNDNTDSQINKT